MINSFFVTGELMRTIMLLHEPCQYFIHLVVFLDIKWWLMRRKEGREKVWER
jgi:hypothetical protein